MLLCFEKILNDDENYDESSEINHNLNWPYISDHPYRILIIGGSGQSKTNVWVNLIKNTSKNHLYIKNTVKSKYQLLINGKEKVGIKNRKSKTIHYYSQTIDDVYENLEDNKEIQQKKEKC